MGNGGLWMGEGCRAALFEMGLLPQHNTPRYPCPTPPPPFILLWAWLGWQGAVGQE